MFGYLARTLPVIVRASLHRDGSLVSRLRRRVRLSEIDPNIHMNQAVFAMVTEYGRTDWVIRSRAWTQWRRAGIRPVVAEQRIIYRRELRAGARYTLDTRATAIEGRLLVVELGREPDARLLDQRRGARVPALGARQIDEGPEDVH